MGCVPSRAATALQLLPGTLAIAVEPRLASAQPGTQRSPEIIDRRFPDIVEQCPLDSELTGKIRMARPGDQASNRRIDKYSQAAL